MLGVGVFFVFYKNEPGVIKELIPTAQVYPHTITNESKIPEGSRSFGVGVNSPTPNPITTPGSISSDGFKLASEINLKVPFTPQAPHANWDEIHQEFCEEASMLMAASYIKGWDIPDADTADRKMFEIKTFEEERFGYYKDTTAEETATIMKEFYDIDRVKVIYGPTVEDIKKALSESRVVMVPAAGRQLGNPYFRSPGPLYHMLVIKGYTKEGNFITNDPGTRRGADFIYLPSVLMNAIHDWNGGDVEHGRKVIIIVG